MTLKGSQILCFFRSALILVSLGTSSVFANHLTTAEGAVADGTTDDTYNLQQALTYCSNNNVTCEIPAGQTHYVTGPLFMWGGASLISSGHGGLNLNDTGNIGYLINLGISAKADVSGNHLQSEFTGTISNIVFTMTGGAGGRIIYFWHTDGATISDNIFNVGAYPYSATSSGNDNNWVVGGGGILVRENVSILDNTIVASVGPLGNEGIGLKDFDTALIQGNIVTGVGDDPIGIHFSKNVQVLSNTLRSVDGRIFVSSSQSVEIANNKHIRIPARSDGIFYRGIALIYVGFENPGEDNTLAAPQYPDDYIDIHDNELYYPYGSIDLAGAISVFGGRHTTVANNTVVNDTAATSNFAVYVSGQVFRVYQKDVLGNFVLDGNGDRIPIPYTTAWVDLSTGSPDAGFFSQYNYARTHEVTLDSNISGATVGGGTALNFVMVGNCDTHVGPVTLIDNSAPAYQNFFSLYRAECPSGLIAADDSEHPNIIAAETFADTDEDGYPDLFDNCPAVANGDQADIDGNGVGDECDAPPGC
jgi:hypothetical protein